MRHTSPARRCLTFCAAIALGILALLPAAHAENAPGVDALRVAKIASDYLATHGRGAPYVVSIVLESDTFGGPKTSWVVRFSRALLTDGNKEVGIRVKFDGSVSYLIEDKSGPKKRAVPFNS